MDQSNYRVSENLPLGRLVANALGELERLEYSRRSRDRYRAIWEHFIEFSRQRKLGDEFSGDLAARFVEQYRAGDKEAHKPGEGWRWHIVCGVKALEDFAHHGRIERAVTDTEKIHLLPVIKKVLHDYEQYGKDRLQLRPSTLRTRTRELTIFLDFLNTRKTKTLDQIRALDLSEFLSFRGHLKPHTVSRLVSDVRSFLRFLTMRGILQKDLGAELPTIRVPRDAGIPSVWDHQLIIKAARGYRSQFGQRQTRLRHSLAGMPVGIACRGYSHAETGLSPLGRFQDRDYAVENDHAPQPASDRRGRRSGYCAYVPDSTLAPREQSSFAPRILTHEEIRKLLQAVDALEPTARSPLRHLIMPEVFRLLYGCGFRLGEVLNLRVRDADLDQGIVTVRQGKFRKDRLVPLALSLVNRLRKYAASFDNRPLDQIFFPAPNGGPFNLRTVYGLFRKLLLQCGIAHAGRGKGPRIHDLCHTFAVHTLLRWYRDGEDLDAKLPLLATYLGHQHLSGTQRYLHLTAELFPEITARLDAVFGEVIPRRIEP